MYLTFAIIKEIRLECDCRDALPPKHVRPKSRVRSRKQNPMGARISSSIEGYQATSISLSNPGSGYGDLIHKCHIPLESSLPAGSERSYGLLSLDPALSRKSMIYTENLQKFYDF